MRPKSRKGFTLIELLVVVLILAILMAIALPLYLSAVKDSQKKTCRSNMQTIANAVQAARVRLVASDYSGFMGAIDLTKETDLQAAPVCPNGGTYTISAGDGAANTGTISSAATPATSFQVNCSYDSGGADAHGTYEPGVDSK